MQDYPVYKPEKYQGLGLLLSSARQKRQNPETQTYGNQYATKEAGVTFRVPSPEPGPPRVFAHQPQSVSRIEERVKGELIKGNSRIQYVPVEKKVVDFVDEPRYSVVPRKRIVTDYRDIKRVDIVPRQVVTTDYYAIQHIRSYVPQVIPQKYTDYVAVEKRSIKYEYIPVQRQLVHYPNTSHQDEASKYLGVRETQGPKMYENLRQSDIQFWERQYGYVRGEPISVLNEKIKRKVQSEKEMYFKQFQSKTTMDSSYPRPQQYETRQNLTGSQQRQVIQTSIQKS